MIVTSFDFFSLFFFFSKPSHFTITTGFDSFFIFISILSFKMKLPILSMLMLTMVSDANQNLRKLPKEEQVTDTGGGGGGGGGGTIAKTWSTTRNCNCYEYMTDPIFRSNVYDFDEEFQNGKSRFTFSTLRECICCC